MANGGAPVRHVWENDRLLLILVGVAFLLADLAVVWVGRQGDWAYDFSCCYQQAGARLATDPGSLYSWSADYTFRYSPWAAFLFQPLALLSEGAAVAAWFVLKAVVVVIVAVAFSRPWSGRNRLLVAAAVLAFPPIWHDLMIGNVSVFTVAMLLVLLRTDRGAGGALLGLLLLLAPKPHLIAVAIWAAVRRPRDAVAGAVVLVVGIASGVVIWGPDLWLAYARTFSDPLTHDFTANIGFSGRLGPAGVVVGVIVGAVVGVIALRRRDAIGLGISLIAGLLASPYLFIHYLSGLIVVVEPTLRARPRSLAIYPWLLLVTPLIPVWLLALAATLHRTHRRC